MPLTTREGYDDAAAILGDAAKVNQILQVLPWRPASHASYDQYFMATRMGKGAFSKPNAAMNIMSSKGDYMEEPVKLYDGESRVDERVLKGVTDPAKTRDSEDVMNLEGALQDWVTALFYGSELTTPDGFKGFHERRKTLSGNPYVLGCGGTGSDTTSLWIMELSKRGLHNVAVLQTGCIGMCQKEPLLDIVRPGEDRVTYGPVKPEDVPRIIADHLVNGIVVEDLVVAKIPNKD